MDSIVDPVRIAVERLIRGDVVRNIAYGPTGVVEAIGAGWTIVRYPSGTMPYRHGQDKLTINRSALGDL